MSNDLLIIESPKKIALLSKILRDLGEPYSIAATYGRLYDIEAVDPHEFSRDGRVRWKPVNPDRVESILDRLSGARNVVVATDSDIEGEVIAWHLQRLAEIAGQTVNRVHVKSLTPEGIRKALDNPVPVDMAKAEGGVARRIFDNFSQFAIDDYKGKQKPYLKGAVSRVVTPLVASIAREELLPTVIKRTYKGADVDVIARVPAGVNPDRVESKIASLPRPMLGDKNESTETLEPLNMADAITICSSALKRTPSESFNDLKELFDKGRISYFRSDSRRASPEALNTMSQALSNHVSLSGVRDSRIGHDVPGAQDAHEGIIPLDLPSNPFASLANMPPDEATLSILWRHYAMVLNQSRVRKVSRELSCSAAESSGWAALQRLGVDLEFTREYLENGTGSSREWDPTFLAHGVPSWSSRQGPVMRRNFSGEELVFQRMVDLNIGRPSTLSMHAAKFGSRFISGGVLNGRGMAAINEARNVCPNLLDPQVARKVEAQLHDPEEGVSVTDKVVEALSASGWLKSTEPSLAPDQPRKARSFTQSFDM